MTLKLEVGKTYVDGNFDLVTIIGMDPYLPVYPFFDKSGKSYTANGRYNLGYHDHPFDLISDYTEKTSTQQYAGALITQVSVNNDLVDVPVFKPGNDDIETLRACCRNTNRLQGMAGDVMNPITDEMTEAYIQRPEISQADLEMINKDSRLQSMIYDLGLMPEQIPNNPLLIQKLEIICHHWKHNFYGKSD